MTQTIWTVIAKSEIGTAIYPQDTASSTDKIEIAKWMEPVLDNGATVVVIEITDHGVVDVTDDMIEFCAAEIIGRDDGKGFEAWVQDSAAYSQYEEEVLEAERADAAEYHRNPAAYYGCPSRL